MKKLVYPGEFIANEEEYMSGPGTYAEDGKVYAGSLGEPCTDSKTREASVCGPIKTPREMHRGLTVFAKIENVREKMAFVTIMPPVTDKYRYVPSAAQSMIRVNNIKRGFVRQVSDDLKTNDIIRGKIIDADAYTILLSTEEPELGVVKALCSRCGNALRKQSMGLACEACGWKEKRKTATDYGSARM